MVSDIHQSVMPFLFAALEPGWNITRILHGKIHNGTSLLSDGNMNSCIDTMLDIYEKLLIDIPLKGDAYSDSITIQIYGRHIQFNSLFSN